jgi:hypothetical protein
VAASAFGAAAAAFFCRIASTNFATSEIIILKSVAGITTGEQQHNRGKNLRCEFSQK